MKREFRGPQPCKNRVEALIFCLISFSFSSRRNMRYWNQFDIRGQLLPEKIKNRHLRINGRPAKLKRRAIIFGNTNLKTLWLTSLPPCRQQVLRA